MNPEHFDGGVGTGEVGAGAGRKILAIGLAADGGHHDVQAGDVDGLHAPPEEQKIAPSTLHNHQFGVPDGRKIESCFTAKSKPGGNEAGIGKVSAAIGRDRDLAGKILFKQGPDLAKTVRPICADEIETDGGRDEECSGGDEEPQASFLSRLRGTCSGGKSCHKSVFPGLFAAITRPALRVWPSALAYGSSESSNLSVGSARLPGTLLERQAWAKLHGWGEATNNEVQRQPFAVRERGPCAEISSCCSTSNRR